MAKNIYKLYADIKFPIQNKSIKFVQHDKAELHFRLYDKGKLINLSMLSSAELVSKLPSGVIVQKEALIEQDIVRYLYSGEEMNEIGVIDTILFLYDDNKERISSMPFTVEMIQDHLNGGL